MCFRRQSLRKMYPVRLAFLRFWYIWFFFSLTILNTSFFTGSVQMIFPILLQDHFKTSKVLLIYFSKLPFFSIIQKLRSKCSILLVYSLCMRPYFRGDIWFLCVCGTFRGYKVQSDCNNISKRTALGQTIYAYPSREKHYIQYNNNLGHYKPHPLEFHPIHETTPTHAQLINHVHVPSH
jgi:hypothetical protein